jgi:hypothetical protein
MSDQHFICLDTDIERARAKRWIDAAPEGWIMSLQEGTRTADQNAKFHAMITDIAKNRGWMWAGKKRTVTDWKRILVNQFENDAGIDTEIVPSLDGQRVVVLGSQTRAFGKKKASDFVEYLYALGAEYRVIWSEPAMRAYEEMRRAA